MGFPMGYSDLPLPRLLLHVLLLLGSLRRLVSRAFDAAGLGDLLESDNPCPESEPDFDGGNPTSARRHHVEFRSVSAMLVDEFLPIARYGDLSDCHVSGECAVCLYDFDGGDEIRRLSNCRHVFHRCCLDRWIEHEQRTCPLCRAALLPAEAVGHVADEDRVWAAAGIPDSYYGDEYSPPFPFVPLSSPDLLFQHQFLFTQ